MKSDLIVDEQLTIPADELIIDVARSSGPGGQHVNKSNTKVRVSLFIAGSSALSSEQKTQLFSTLGHRINRSGLLAVECDRARSQRKNMEDALNRLRLLIVQGLHVPKERKATAPSYGQRMKRLKAKKQRGAIKAQRRRKDWDDG